MAKWNKNIPIKSYWKGQNLRNLRHWWLIERFRMKPVAIYNA